MQVFHGKIITCDADNTVANYLVERDGRIAYIGDKLPRQYEIAPPIELGKNVVVPAFVDTHNHYSAFSVLHRFFPVSDTDSNSKILEQLRIYARDSKENIIIGFGASEFSVIEGHLILKEQLDAICPDKPMCVIKYDAHSCVVNSALIDLIKAKAYSLRGFNESTGEMKQEAFGVVMELISKGFSTRRVIEAMMETMDFMASKGIGLVCSASGVGFVRDFDFDMEKSVAKGLDNGMQMKVTYQTDTVAKAAKKEMTRIVYKNLDGMLANADAYMCEDYDKYSHKGISYFTDEEVCEFCKEANRAGYQIALHASGDAAFNQAVNAIAQALEDYPRYDHRHMILHANLPTESGLKQCAKYHIMLCVQPQIVSFPKNANSHILELLGQERFDNINPLKTCLDMGIRVCFNSDAPATEPNPISWIHEAVNNANQNQAISVYEALRMATYYGAKACFDEKERGTLEMGKSCDLTILDQDIYEIEPEKINTIGVKQLYLKGKPYEASRTGAMATMLRGMFPQ